MKNASQYWFGMNLGDLLPEEDITTLWQIDGFLGKPTAYQDFDGFSKDAFRADNTPVSFDNNTIYPVYAPWYLGTLIPEAFLRVEPTYSQTAAQAAISWTTGLFVCQGSSPETLDALTFECGYHNHIFKVQFPLCKQPSPAADAIIVPVADTWRNESEWGQGIVPGYVEQHVRFLLWCYRYYNQNCDSNLFVPECVYVPRIIGNLPDDVTVYTVIADPAADQKAAERVLRAFAKAQDTGTNPILNRKSQPEICWMEKRDAELADAYHTDDPELYDLIRRFMEARSRRKELEAQDKQLKAEADAIAVSLAALTKDDANTGRLDAGPVSYTVKHTPSRKQPPKVTPPLIYQFAPNYANLVLKEGARRVSVSIDVL